MADPQLTQFIPDYMEDYREQLRLLAFKSNQLAEGKVNTVTTFTLTAAALTHTFVDSRVGPNSFIGLEATNSQSAARKTTIWISDRQDGKVIFASGTSATTSETFVLVILG